MKNLPDETTIAEFRMTNMAVQWSVHEDEEYSRVRAWEAGVPRWDMKCTDNIFSGDSRARFEEEVQRIMSVHSRSMISGGWADPVAL